jgi:hypothetical protein
VCLLTVGHEFIVLGLGCPIPGDLYITEIQIPVFMQVQHNQRAPESGVQQWKSHTQHGTDYSNDHYTITTSIDRQVQDNE